jgi:hypothetical protein
MSQYRIWVVGEQEADGCSVSAPSHELAAVRGVRKMIKIDEVLAEDLPIEVFVSDGDSEWTYEVDEDFRPELLGEPDEFDGIYFTEDDTGDEVSAEDLSSGFHQLDLGGE